MRKWEQNGGARSKHNKTKHDETKPKTNDIKYTNLPAAQQPQAYRDAICPGCGDAKETVHHFLMVCPKYERKRDRMRREVGIGGMNMEKLLGDSRRIKDTVDFIVSTE